MAATVFKLGDHTSPPSTEATLIYLAIYTRFKIRFDVPETKMLEKYASLLLTSGPEKSEHVSIPPVRRVHFFPHFHHLSVEFCLSFYLQVSVPSPLTS